MVAPWEVLDAHGADAFRWYYFTSKQPWDGYRFSLETVGESVRQFMQDALEHLRLLRPLRERQRRRARRPRELTDLDRWALSRLPATTETAIERLDDYDTTTAGRAIAAFVDDLSNWYVRRSRRRFWDGDPAAFCDAAHLPASTVSKLLAPLTPFVADAIYENLDGSRAVGAPLRLPGAPASATRSSSGRCRSRATPSSSAAPRARRRRSRCASRWREAVIVAGRPRARGDRALRGPGPRRAEREARSATSPRPRSSAAAS